MLFLCFESFSVRIVLAMYFPKMRKSPVAHVTGRSLPWFRYLPGGIVAEKARGQASRKSVAYLCPDSLTNSPQPAAV